MGYLVEEEADGGVVQREESEEVDLLGQAGQVSGGGLVKRWPQGEWVGGRVQPGWLHSKRRRDWKHRDTSYPNPLPVSYLHAVAHADLGVEGTDLQEAHIPTLADL